MKESIFRGKPRLLSAGRSPASTESQNGHGACDVVFFGRSGAHLSVNGIELYPVSGDIVVIDRAYGYTADCSRIPSGSAIFLTVADATLYGDFSFASESGCRIVASGIYRGISEAAFRQILREYEMKCDAGGIVINNLLNVILTLTVRLMPFEIRPHKSSEVFKKAKEYFDENFLTDEPIADICKKLNIDRYYLSHIFKRDAGIPPKKYLIDKRMEYAAQLLRMTEKDINVVARDCGYADTAYFCRIFKQTQGRTALGYRANYKLKKAEEEKKK